MRYIILAASIALVFSITGCGKDAHTVSGTVTYDGTPLPDGDILFIDPENKVAPDAGKIKDGKFSVAVKPGKKKVEIRASKMQPLPGGKKGAMGETETPVDYIPDRYNTKSELTADISGGSSSLEFKLLSK